MLIKLKVIRLEAEDLPDADGHLMAQWRAKGRLTGGKFKRCQDCAFQHRWEVRISLTGVGQQLVAYAPCGARVPVADAITAGMRAARFADMAVVHFSAYRRKVEPICDADLNFSLAQAKDDLDASPNLKHLLNLMTNQLRDEGHFPERREDNVSLLSVDKQVARLGASITSTLDTLSRILGPEDADIVELQRRLAAVTLSPVLLTVRKKIRTKFYEEPQPPTPTPNDTTTATQIPITAAAQTPQVD